MGGRIVDKPRAELQLRQFVHTFRRDGSLHGAGSRRIYKGRIPKTVTLGSAIRIDRTRLQMAIAAAVLGHTDAIYLTRRQEPLRPLIVAAALPDTTKEGTE
jgi:hypothetical protein